MPTCRVAQQGTQNAEKPIDKLRELDYENSSRYKRRWLFPSTTEHTIVHQNEVRYPSSNYLGLRHR